MAAHRPRVVPHRNDFLRCACLGRECVVGLVVMSDEWTPTSVTICAADSAEYTLQTHGYPALTTIITSDGTQIFGYATGLRRLSQVAADAADAAEDYEYNQAVDSAARRWASS